MTVRLAILASVLLVVQVGVLDASTKIRCSKPLRFQGHMYGLCVGNYTFEDTRRVCKKAAFGSYPVEVTTYQESKFLQENYDPGYWIGLVYAEGEYLWQDSYFDVSTFSNFAKDFPMPDWDNNISMKKGETEECVSIKDKTGQWTMANCEEHLSILCEGVPGTSKKDIKGISISTTSSFH